MRWLITYTTDFNTTQNTQTIAAGSFTEAYLLFSIHYNGIILEIKKI